MNALGRLNQFYGLGALLVEGSQIAAGFEVLTNETYTGGSFDVTGLINDLEGCLYDTGAFSDLSIEYSHGYIYHDYLNVKGTVATAFVNQDDARRLIRGIIGECAPYLSITREDAITVIPPGQYANDPNVANQITQGSLVCPAGSIVQSDYLGRPYCSQIEKKGEPKKPGKCDNLGFTDWIACQLGITKTSAAAVGVVGGALAAIIVLKAIK